MASKGRPLGNGVIVGQRFGRLVTTGYQEPEKGGKGAWRCRCDCGKETTVMAGSLKSGSTNGCGCMQGKVPRKPKDTSSRRQKVNTTHPLYMTWYNMIYRCTNPNAIGYHNYGAAGIKVCERWLNSFPAFVEDVGERPSSGHSLDRYPDKMGDYNPENCRWATRKEQARNTKNSIMITFNGETKTLPEWAEQTGISEGTLRTRLRPAMTVEQALTLPSETKLRRGKPSDSSPPST